MENKIQCKFVIPEKYANQRLDQALTSLLPEYSRTQIQRWISDGSLLIDQDLVKAKSKVKGGEIVTLCATIRSNQNWIAQNISINVVYEDESLIIINKPAGLVVHPGAGNKDSTLLNALLHHAPQLEFLPRAGIIHRLDKDTTGLLVIAKTPKALKFLSEQIKKRTLVREYQAIVYGTIISGGTIEAPLARHPQQRKRIAVIETGKKAITHYRVAEHFRNLTRLKVRLETGRTHQIRVHMAHIHHPLVGDIAYGGRVRLSKGMTDSTIQTLREFKRQALHAFALGLTHPESKKFMRWESDLPADMEHLIKILRKDKEQKK